MNLYKISQTEEDGCDTYSDAIVCAVNEDAARNINPSRHWPTSESLNQHPHGRNYTGWASVPENVTVELVGEAIPSLPEGVVCASFHAG